MGQSSITISIVTPSLNQGRYIEETILSVLNQQYPNFEHIVADGGSTDQTLDVLRRYPHLRWTSEPDRGQTPAINKGVRQASGEIFAYLNADDVYRPGAFQTVAEVFYDDPTTSVLIGDSDMIDDNSRPSGHHRARLERFEDLLRYWEWGNRFCIPQSSVFLRRDAMEQAGLFDERYDLAMDYEMWLRLAAWHPFTFVRRTLAAFRVTEETKTRRHRYRMALEQFQASRRFWRLARWPDRWTIPCEALSHAAGHYLGLLLQAANAGGGR
jgi:glycosyltransferase involved in cell wall biosynthesis